ncbi:hypothetical protein QQF64_032553 [Cirrhinus molitorella]|uniref:Uncharacterized protein n=1 Tax=Cirrhinus molitorella TaxID=172907 RepID=A0ABR3N052_9TELE
MQQSSGGEEREARRTRRYGRSFASCMRDARTAAERLPFLSSFFFLSAAFRHVELFLLSSGSEVHEGTAIRRVQVAVVLRCPFENLLSHLKPKERKEI